MAEWQPSSPEAGKQHFAPPIDPRDPPALGVIILTAPAPAPA